MNDESSYKDNTKQKGLAKINLNIDRFKFLVSTQFCEIQSKNALNSEQC